MMGSSTVAALALLAASSALAATTTTSVVLEEPSSAPVLGNQVVQGCFSSSGDLEFNSTPDYNSKGKCAKTICLALGKAVAATTAGDQCYCGDHYPPKSTLADDSNCNIHCTGYNETCGGVDFYTVYNTGLNLSVHSLEDAVVSTTSSASAAAATKTSATAVITVSGSVVTVTNAATNSAQVPASEGSNTAGIAAGVVVGIVAFAGCVGGLFFYLRRRRNKGIEEEHRRNAAVNSFVGGSKPSSSGGWSIADSRLDPAVMAQRRCSSGSIADNQDYSRKILRVTNA